MDHSRRKLVVGLGAGALIATTGVAATSFLKIFEIDGKRYAMLHDESLCIGCEACVVACKETNDVPDGVTRLEIIRSEPVGEFPDVRYSFFRKSCQHCENPSCVNVCPTGASFIDEKTGIVDVNPDRCIGCQYCIAACPYKVRYVDPVTKSVDKCDFCRKSKLAAGELPGCVQACPKQALIFGDLNDPHSEINIALQNKVVYRHKKYLGTKPKMFRVPDEFSEVQV